MEHNNRHHNQSWNQEYCYQYRARLFVAVFLHYLAQFDFFLSIFCVGVFLAVISVFLVDQTFVLFFNYFVIGLIYCINYLLFLGAY